METNDEKLGAKHQLPIGARPQDLYDICRNPDLHPDVVGHFGKVEKLDGHVYRWHLPIILGVEIEADIQVTADEPGRRLCMRALPGGPWDIEGEFLFGPAGEDFGTLLALQVQASAPSGALRLLLQAAGPQGILEELMLKFKKAVETSADGVAAQL